MLSIVFIDIHPTNTQIGVMWLVIGILNGVLYGWVASIVKRFLWKSN